MRTWLNWQCARSSSLVRSSSTRVDSSRAPHLANGRPLGPWRSACGLLLTLTCLPSSTGPGTYDGAFTKYEHMDDGTWEKRGTRTKKDVENLVGCALLSAAPPQPVSLIPLCVCVLAHVCRRRTCSRRRPRKEGLGSRALRLAPCLPTSQIPTTPSRSGRRKRKTRMLARRSSLRRHLVQH